MTDEDYRQQEESVRKLSYDLDILKDEIEWKNKDDQEAKKIIEEFFNN